MDDFKKKHAKNQKGADGQKDGWSKGRNRRGRNFWGRGGKRGRGNQKGYKGQGRGDYGGKSDGGYQEGM